MAKKTEETKELAKASNSIMASRPSYIPDTKEGLENIAEPVDLKMPRLLLAQKTSKAIDDTNKEYIEGLEFAQYYNNLSNTIYGDEVTITPVFAFKSRVKWNEDKVTIDCSSPNSIDGGELAPLCEVCPHSQFSDDKPPECQLLYNYITYIHNSSEFGTLTLKTTSLDTARRFNALLNLRNGPTYAGRYLLTATKEKNDKGTFAVARVTNDTETPWVEGSLFEQLAKQYIIFRDNHEKLAETIHNNEATPDADVAASDDDVAF